MLRSASTSFENYTARRRRRDEGNSRFNQEVGEGVAPCLGPSRCDRREQLVLLFRSETMPNFVILRAISGMPVRDIDSICNPSPLLQHVLLFIPKREEECQRDSLSRPTAIDWNCRSSPRQAHSCQCSSNVSLTMCCSDHQREEGRVCPGVPAERIPSRHASAASHER